MGDGCVVGEGCTVGDGRGVEPGVMLIGTDASLAQAANRPGKAPRAQSLRNVRRFIPCSGKIS